MHFWLKTKKIFVWTLCTAAANQTHDIFIRFVFKIWIVYFDNGYVTEKTKKRNGANDFVNQRERTKLERQKRAVKKYRENNAMRKERNQYSVPLLYNSYIIQ